MTITEPGRFANRDEASLSAYLRSSPPRCCSDVAKTPQCRYFEMAGGRAEAAHLTARALTILVSFQKETYASPGCQPGNPRSKLGSRER
jgi:hypothetical protein